MCNGLVPHRETHQAQIEPNQDADREAKSQDMGCFNEGKGPYRLPDARTNTAIVEPADNCGDCWGNFLHANDNL